MRRKFLALALAFALVPSSALATSNAENAIALSQAALGQQLPDLALTDTSGRTVRLSDYRGKPLLVSMIYTGCADVCPTLLESLYPAVEAGRRALGEDSFAVITVGFDIRNDTPERLRLFARTRGIDLPNWKFLAADEESLDALAKADAEGRVSQQIYGAVFEPPIIMDPLKALVLRRSEPLKSLDILVDRIRYFCTVYDPKSGRYYFNYSLFISVGIGLLSFSLIVLALVREWWRSTGRGMRPFR